VGSVEFHVHFGTKMEGKPHVMTTAIDLIADLDCTRGPVEPDGAAVPR
jgi:hypothetical protein